MHFERGRDYRRAVQYLRQAGENAVRKHAHREAISHLTRGLELLKILPDTVERARQELRLQIALGAPLIATRGYGAPEVEKAYARARELCQQLGETPQLFPVLFGLWAFYNTRAELQPAQELGEQLLTLAQSVQDPALLLEAHLALGTTLFSLGELASAQVHLEQGIALYDRQQHRSHIFLYGQDPGVASLAYLSWILLLLGYPDQALKRNYEALTLAQETSHPFSLAWALIVAAVVHLLRVEWHAAQEQAVVIIALCAEQEFAFLLATGGVLRGWALAEQGQMEEGIAQMHQGMVAYRATGAELGRPLWLALLAEAYEKWERLKRGLPYWPKLWVQCPKLGSMSTTRSCIGSRESSCWRGRQKSKGKRQKWKDDRGGSVFSSGHRCCPSPGGEVSGAAGSDEFKSAVAEPG
jgi:tetratricopeptide (TPR) repeat protein